MKKEITRREFLGSTALAATVVGLGVTDVLLAKPKGTIENDLNIHVFSKHLQFLNYDDMANAAAEIGFQGVDLSVRPKGHVLPENVVQDLPLAVESLKKNGLPALMMTSGITDSTAAYTNMVLKIAAEQGIRLYRLGYYRWTQDGTVVKDLKQVKAHIKKLQQLNRQYGIKAAFQNHAGLYVGASIYEIHELLKYTDGTIGCQYDIRHASVEGAKSWPTQLRLIAPKINSIVLKDYKWEMDAGKWKLVNVPLGEGMVDFKTYFKMLKKLGINVPVSMHFEYDLGGAEHGLPKINGSQKTVFKAMQRDLNKARELWKTA